MTKSSKLVGLSTMSEVAKELDMLKTTLEYYWIKGLIKPDAVRVMGWGDVITDPRVIHDSEELKKLKGRYQFYFDKNKVKERVEKIKELQSEKRWTIKEIQDYFFSKSY